MKDQLVKLCEKYIADREVVKSVYRGESGLSYLAAASIFLAKGKEANAESLQAGKEMLKKKVSAFSNFRANAKVTVAAVLSTSENKEEMMERTLLAYKSLKKEFGGSEYLTVASMALAQDVAPERFDEYAERAKAIYRLMKKNHPLLTSSEDSVFCVLFAMMERPAEVLTEEAEKCFTLLKKRFGKGNAVQSLSHVLALYDGTAEEKVQKTIDLYEVFKAKKTRYGRDYELATLGVLAMLNVPQEALVDEIIEVEGWLKAQKGFGFWSDVSRTSRLMFAGMLVQKQYENTDIMSVTAVQSVIASLIAQEVAVCCAIAASVSASAATSSN